MANPNIVNVTDIKGKTAVKALTTNAQTLVTNPASSGKVLKINTILVANVDGVNTQEVTVNYYEGGNTDFTATALVSTVSLPADATLVVLDKNSSIYLEEDRTIGALAGGNSDLVATISYEEIS